MCGESTSIRSEAGPSVGSSSAGWGARLEVVILVVPYTNWEQCERVE